jgi:uncharacterized protein (DUF1499 family)
VLAVSGMALAEPVSQAVQRMANCPSSPNCVSSLATDEEHRIEPLRYTGSRDAAQLRMIKAIQNQPHARITANEPGYLHVEFTTAIMRFTDDVEMLLPEGAGLIQVRSASRVGYSDLGANRRRVETLRKAFEQGG